MILQQSSGTQPASRSFVLGVSLTLLTCFLSISNGTIHFHGTITPFAVKSYFDGALASDPVYSLSALTEPVRAEERLKD